MKIFTLLVILCLASVVVADDFKTIEGKEYKNVTVSREEPDGIIITNKKAGLIVKLYFSELPKEVQERFHYDAAKGDAHSAEQNAKLEALPKTPTLYFNDYAGVISQGKQHELNERLARFDKDTTNQVVVAIFSKMDSALSLDEYTLRVANSWGIGHRGKNNGVVLFVFLQERKMRIQVGYGLTGMLTNELSKTILDQDLKPHFENGDFDGGLTAAVDTILKSITGPTSH